MNNLRSQNSDLQATKKASEQHIRVLVEALLAQIVKPQIRRTKISFLAKWGIDRDDPPSPQDLHKDLTASGLFDAKCYLETYPDVENCGLDPLTHYLEHSAAAGRNPSASFDGAAYLEANPHLKGLGISPLEHVLRQLAITAGMNDSSNNKGVG